MKRALAETAPRWAGPGLATRHAAHSGLRPEDAALLSTLRMGAPAAVEALFDRYQEKVYGLAMSILMNKSDAEEATREVFLTMVGKADRFQWSPALHFWIYRICVNSCLMRLRKGRRTETAPIEDFLPVFTGEGAHARLVEDWSREVDLRIPDQLVGRVIGGFTAALPEKYLVVFALRDVQGFSNEETAQVLNLTIAEVKSRFYRARFYLRERLSRYLRNARTV
jgi:RNA polymerase sigma-70 factor, ECF subfamily